MHGRIHSLPFSRLDDEDAEEVDDELVEDDVSSARARGVAESSSAPAARAARDRFMKKMGKNEYTLPGYVQWPIALWRNVVLRAFPYSATVLVRGVVLLPMHVRFLMSVGVPIIASHSDECIGAVSGLFLHPDLGMVEGFFVRTDGGEAFLSVSDISHWGKFITVNDGEVLGPLEERVRLLRLWEEARPILGQKIETESGMFLGRCADVQFDTESFRVEWLFPRRWFRWKRPIPVSSILEVTPEVVRVRDSEIVVKTPVERLPAIATLEATVQGE